MVTVDSCSGGVATFWTVWPRLAGRVALSSSQQRSTDEVGTCLPEAKRATEIHEATFEACSLKYSSIVTDGGDSAKTRQRPKSYPRTLTIIPLKQGRMAISLEPAKHMCSDYW